MGPGPGGRGHLFAFARIDGNDWRALAELAAAPLLAQANARTVLSVLLAGITLGTGFLAASLIARHISRPLRALERAIDAAGAGHYAQAADDGPREVQNLARNLTR